MDILKNKLLQPNVDFKLVRDGRRSPLFYYDVDLTNARSVAAGTHLILQVAGDSFYVDKNPLITGSATVHFQDTTLGIAPAPVYCDPGFIANVPFTQALFENVAQPGKVFRFFYGVGIDFQPGAASSIVISGGVAVSGGLINVRPEEATGSFTHLAALVGNTAVNVFTAASNPNGTILLSADISEFDNVLGNGGFIAKATAPVNVSDGVPIFINRGIAAYDVTNFFCGGTLPNPQFVAAGLGLWYIRAAALPVGNGNIRACTFKQL